MRTTPIEWALFYLKEMQFSIIPINPKNKKPLIPAWGIYQKERPIIANGLQILRM